MNPQKVDKIYQVAQQALSTGNDQLAHKNLMLVARAKSREFIFNLQLAQVCFRLANYETAQKAITLMQNAAIPNLEALSQAFDISLTLHQLAAAKYFATQAQVQDEKLGVRLLSEYHERTHDIDAAHLILSEYSSADDLSLAVTKTKILRRSDQLDKALELITSSAQIAEKSADKELRIEILYELAATQDAAGDYSTAFESLTKAKTIFMQLPGIGVMLNQAKGASIHRKAYLESINADHYAQWTSEASDLDRSSVGVVTGHPRSGTTLLERMLDRHPELSTVEESNALAYKIATPFGNLAGTTATLESISKLFSGLKGAKRKTMARDYLKALNAFAPVKKGSKMLIDRNPLHTALLPHIHAVFPQAPVIIILRDPRDVCLSFFMQHLDQNAVSVRLDTLVNVAYSYMEVMSMWLKVREFNSPQFLEIKYEDLVESPDACYSKIIQHLGIPDYPLDNSPINPEQRQLVMTPSYEAVTKPIYKSAIGRWKNYKEHFAEAEEILAPAIKAFGYFS